MTDKPPMKSRVRARFQARSGRFWATALAILAVTVLYVGSQFAHDQGQSVSWYTGFGQWLGALGSFAAAGVALWISVGDRRDRQLERLAEEKAVARLVRMSLDWFANRAALIVQVRNFGLLPVLDVELVGAEWSDHPDAAWVTIPTGWQARGLPNNTRFKPMLKPNEAVQDTFDTVFELNILFSDAAGQALASVEPVTAESQYPNYVPMDFTKVVVRIRFTTVNGIRWEIANSGTRTAEPVRVTR